MAGLICLTIAAVCAIVSRILLLIAALKISVWWAVGVFLPFGPTMFRLSYPDAARSSFIFRVATLGCIFLYFTLGSSALMDPFESISDRTDSPRGYASEFASRFVSAAAPTRKTDTRSVAERRAANAREFERLNQWSEALRIQKRELLQTDVEGNRAYHIDLQEYQSALAAANAEKAILAAAPAK